jgi:hypothetical protein
MRFIQSGDSDKSASGTVDSSVTPPYNEAKQKEKPDGIQIKIAYKICGRICHAFSIQLLPKKAKTG